MKAFCLLALVGLCAGAARIQPVQLATLNFGSVKGRQTSLTWDGDILTVPQHCRAETCSDHGALIKKIQDDIAVLATNTATWKEGVDKALQQQLKENSALRALIRADAQDLDTAEKRLDVVDAELARRIDVVTKMEGPKGAKGDKGDKGDQGPQGVKGDDGADGADGVNGAKGDQGPQGVKGNKGKDGIDGTDGTNGSNGSPGAKGDKGDKGNPGAKGEKGSKGDKGDKGDKGNDGDSGASLTWGGWDAHVSQPKQKHCAGDCDADSHCKSGCTCRHNLSTASLNALGCKGTVHTSSADYCVC